MPGDNIKLKMRMNVPLAIIKGMRFAIRESGSTIGHGIVTGVLDDDAIPKDIKRTIKK